MGSEVKWTPQAEKGLENVLSYLDSNWSVKEILNLKHKIQRVIELIKINPEIFPKSKIKISLHKAIIDKNNYLIYRFNTANNSVEIVNFRGTKQTPKH